MDGVAGFKTTAVEELPEATAVMDPFHVVRLACDWLDRHRRRFQHQLHAHRSRASDPLYRARRMLHTGFDLPIPRQRARLDAPCSPTTAMSRSKSPGDLPTLHRRLARTRQDQRQDPHASRDHRIQRPYPRLPGRGHHTRTNDETASRQRPGLLRPPDTSNGPTDAINGRLKHLRGFALGFRNLTHHIAQTLLETGRFTPQLHPQL